MRKPKKVSSSLNHRWFYSYGKPLKFLSGGLSEKTHKGFISKPFKLLVKTFNVFFKLLRSNPTWQDIIHLDTDVCKVLSFFYTVTGCDTVSSFIRKRKCISLNTDEKPCEDNIKKHP